MAALQESQDEFIREYHQKMASFTKPQHQSNKSNPSTLKQNNFWSVPSAESSKTPESHAGRPQLALNSNGTGNAVQPVDQRSATLSQLSGPHSGMNTGQNLDEAVWEVGQVTSNNCQHDSWFSPEPTNSYERGHGQGRGRGRRQSNGRGRGRGRGRARRNYGSHFNQGSATASSGTNATGSVERRSNAHSSQVDSSLRKSENIDNLKTVGMLQADTQKGHPKGQVFIKKKARLNQARSSKLLSLEDVKRLHEEQGHVPNVPDCRLEGYLLSKQHEAAAKEISRKDISSKDNVRVNERSNAGFTSAWDDDGALAYPKPEYIIKNPDDYDVPALGSDRMPAVSIKPMPKRQTLWQQINVQLEPDLRDVPPPSYPFSKKKKEAVDPAKVGAVPNPPPQNLTPLANPLSKLAEQQIRVNVPKEGYAESDFDGEIADSNFVIVSESIKDASRWRWFAGPAVSDVGDPDKRFLSFQLTRWDKHFNFAANEAGPRAGELWLEPSGKGDWIDRWVSRMTANQLKCPYAVDMTDDGFVSGRVPGSGVQYNYQEFPADIGYRPVRLLYGAIDWNAIPQPKLNDPVYKMDMKFNQTSQRMVSIRMAKRERFLQDRKVREAMKRAETKRRRYVQAEIQRPIDTSQAQLVNNPWRPSVNMHVRVAKNSDIYGAMFIYNHWVMKTIDAPETVKVDYEAMKARVQATRNESYPFLVAVLRVEPGEAPARRSVNNKSTMMVEGGAMEHVIGFARARSYSGIGTSCFDDIALLEVFVSPQYTKHKVAANLLDRLIGCLDADYLPRRGARIEVEPYRLQWTGSWRRTHSHVIRMYYRDVDEPRFVGRKNFLEDEFGFSEFGAFPECCSKDNGRTRYNMVFLQRAANRLFSPPS